MERHFDNSSTYGGYGKSITTEVANVINDFFYLFYRNQSFLPFETLANRAEINSNNPVHTAAPPQR